MSTKVPKLGLIVLLVAAFASGVAFWVLNRAFGGPGVHLSAPYEARAELADSQQLLVKSLVMVNGVRVGEVTGVDAGRDGTRVTFTVDPEYRPLHAGASVQVGSRTAFGEAYLRLRRGSPRHAALRSGATIASKPTVEADEALQVLGAGTRTHLRGILKTTGEAVAARGADDQLHDAIAGGDDAVAGLRDLTATLHGQEGDIAGLVTDGGTLVSALAARDGSLRTIVGAGRTTLSAVASRRRQLEAGLAEVAPTTRAASATLADLPALIADAGPVARDAAAAAKALRPALDRLPPAARSASATLKQLPKATDAVVPSAREALPVMRLLEPVGKMLSPTLRDMIPLSRWLAPRAKSYATVLANIASASAHGDSDGAWLRLFLFPDRNGTLGLPMEKCSDGGQRREGGGCTNAYPKPGDALRNRPYEPGSYPRLKPYPEP